MLPVIVPTVHVNVAGALDVSAMFGLVPLQMAAVPAVVTAGVGLTVTVIVYGAGLAHDPVLDVGVTRYSTDPAVALLGLVNTWLIVDPLPALAPVIPPVMVPIVQANVDGADDVSAMFVAVPLQIDFVDAVVTAGVGLTVTVIVYGAPAHDPVTEVGVTIYCTVPAVALLGLVSVWLMVPPLPALAPVMPPVIVPIVHVNVDGALDVSAMFGLVALQIAAVAALVTTGVGFTVTTIG
jgi:ABC-type proline/glycine betaine transport system permease subunit